MCIYIFINFYARFCKSENWLVINVCFFYYNKHILPVKELSSRELQIFQSKPQVLGNLLTQRIFATNETLKTKSGQDYLKFKNLEIKLIISFESAKGITTKVTLFIIQITLN